MMLWDIIRNFFVRYIFGGSITINGETFCYGGLFGNIVTEADDISGGAVSVSDTYIKLPIFDDANYGVSSNAISYMSIGDYLSTTATIIVMVLLCFLLVKLAIWIFKLGANLIRLR